MKAYQQTVYALVAGIIIGFAFFFGAPNQCHAADVRIGSSAHYQTDEAAMPVAATPGPVDCDIQAPGFSACLHAHAGELVNLPEPKATRVVIDADGTVHLLGPQ